MNDPALPVSDVADTRALTGAVGTLGRRLQFTPAVIPFAVIGGTPRPSGFQSVDSTTYVEVVRSDCWVTAPLLDYDIQVTDAYGSATSIDWKIEAQFPLSATLSTATLATGTGVTGTQFSAVINLFDLTSELAFSEYLSARLSVKRTGGAGEGAGIRMVKPWLLRAAG